MATNYGKRKFCVSWLMLNCNYNYVINIVTALFASLISFNLNSAPHQNASIVLMIKTFLYI